jgi:hypothetical protein
MQSSIFDQAEQKKTLGVELVFRHANSEWKQAAADKLLEIIELKQTFTSDDILIPLERAGMVTGDNRAIAAVLLSAARLKLIRASDRFVNCRRKSRHNAPIRVWESLRYKGASDGV